MPLCGWNVPWNDRCRPKRKAESLEIDMQNTNTKVTENMSLYGFKVTVLIRL